jgi:hypothetical protein
LHGVPLAARVALSAQLFGFQLKLESAMEKTALTPRLTTKVIDFRKGE